MKRILGDPHCGQKQVFLVNNYLIYKPRSIYWEWLFLGKESIFIKELKLSVSNKGNFLITLWDQVLPSLDFYPKDSKYSSGYVEYQKCKPINSAIDNEVFWESCGAVIALVSLFGITDLHRENMLIGKNTENKLVFGPIDIECIFNSFTSLTQTHLLPSKKISSKMCGLSKLKEVFYAEE